MKRISAGLGRLNCKFMPVLHFLHPIILWFPTVPKMEEKHCKPTRRRGKDTVATQKLFAMIAQRARVRELEKEIDAFERQQKDFDQRRLEAKTRTFVTKAMFLL